MQDIFIQVRIIDVLFTLTVLLALLICIILWNCLSTFVFQERQGSSSVVIVKHGVPIVLAVIVFWAILNFL